MRIALGAFILGIVSIRFFPFLPPLSVFIALGCLGIIILPWRLYPLGALCIGISWGGWAAIDLMADRLEPHLEGQIVWIEGRIASLPASSGKALRFQVQDVISKNNKLPTTIRLSWYNGESVITGERWRFKVRLKSPRGTVNPYVFDYEAWLTAKHIGATGAIREGYRLKESTYASDWRYLLKEKIKTSIPHENNAGLIALVLGDGSGLTTQQWQILQETGTIHLMVISGQHITLLAGLLYFIVVGLVRLGWWPRRLPWLPFACGLAMAGALVYGALAGFEVPVQRACIMLALVLIWRLRFRYLGVVTPFLITLAIILAIDPLASLQAGFWLSFLAVAILLLIFSGRLGRSNWCLNALKIEMAMTVGLLPALLALLLPISLTSPVANLIAIPLVSFIIVPFALVGTVLIAIPYLGSSLLWLAGYVLKLLFSILSIIAAIVPAWVAPMPSWWAIVLAFVGVFLLLLPRGALLSIFGVIFCLPLIFVVPPAIKEGSAEIIVFDVGQGTSVLVKTKAHYLLYDTGPSFGDFNLGERVVLPSIQRMGVAKLDKVIVSHADTDHSGGLQPITQRLMIDHIISGEPHKLTNLQTIDHCQNSSWVWDGVRFSLWQWTKATSSNDLSCVLLIAANGERLLLTGDISSRAEQAWARDNNIKIHWLLAAHHGSKQSSSKKFLAVIEPDNIIVSRGWLNSFNHPSPMVLSRYEEINARVEDTALTGALVIKLGSYLPVARERDKKYFWRKQ